MAVLVGRSAVKDIANVPSADTRWDPVIDALRERATRDVEEATGRAFAEAEYVEFHPSYNQVFGDPTPQWVIVKAPPIQSVAELVFAPFDDHDDNGTPLVQGQDWQFEENRHGEKWALRVQRFSSVPTTLPLPAGFTSILQESPTGFRVTYTGGYAASATTVDPDPLDEGEEGVIGAPSALQHLVALKVADDLLWIQANRRQDPEQLSTILQAGGLLRPWSADQAEALRSWTRRDLDWARPGRYPASARSGRYDSRSR